MNVETQDRALRKRMLVARAQVERAELGERVISLRASTRWSGLLSSGLKATTLSGVLSTAIWMFRRYPVLGSGLSLVTARLTRGGIPRVLRTALKYGAALGLLGLLGWQGWRWWQRNRRPRDEQFR